jgi:plastocyanin
VAGAGLLTACAGPEPSGKVHSGPAPGDAVEIVADDMFFHPERIDLPVTDAVTLEITNAGDMPHELSIDELDISTGTIEPGQVKTVTFDVTQGPIEFVCAFHGGMRGTIVGSTGRSVGSVGP